MENGAGKVFVLEWQVNGSYEVYLVQVTFMWGNGTGKVYAAE